MNDRREQHRYSVWFPMKLDGAGAEDGVAVSRNVSDTGMLMVAASRLAVGGSITVTFRVANVVPTQTVTGHIVRCEPNTESSGLWPYRIAVAFDEMHADLEEMMRVLETAQAPAATK